MTDSIAAVVSANGGPATPVSSRPVTPTASAIGGTLYGNALSMAAARIGLAEIFTTEAGQRVDELGHRLQTGLQREIDNVACPQQIDRLGGRLQFRLARGTPKRRRELRLDRPAARRRPQGFPAQPRGLGRHRHRRAVVSYAINRADGAPTSTRQATSYTSSPGSGCARHLCSVSHRTARDGSLDVN